MGILRGKAGEVEKDGKGGVEEFEWKGGGFPAHYEMYNILGKRRLRG